jgi:hypothetical protein
MRDLKTYVKIAVVIAANRHHVVVLIRFRRQNASNPI